MAFASAVIMLVASPQNFLGLAGSQTFVPVMDVLTVYGRHVSSEVRQVLTRHFTKVTKRHEDRPAVAPLNECRKIGFECLGDTA
jgi:hypothetical protein